jgi:uncharacterized protein YfaP (DUF2135 family)
MDRFHVYYNAKNFYYMGMLYANLDVDDITSYGPETVTIYEQVQGFYRYSVHDYTNREYAYSAVLANSNAQVRVYKGSELINTFNVPSNLDGTLWTVFEYTGNTIIPINTMTYTSDPSSITKSAGTIGNDGYLMDNLPGK